MRDLRIRLRPGKTILLWNCIDSFGNLRRELMIHHPAILWLLSLSIGLSVLVPQSAVPCCTGSARDQAAACCKSCEEPSSCADADYAPVGDSDDSHHSDRLPAPCHGTCFAQCCVKVLYSNHADVTDGRFEDSQLLESTSDAVPPSDFSEKIFHPPGSSTHLLLIPWPVTDASRISRTGRTSVR